MSPSQPYSRVLSGIQSMVFHHLQQCFPNDSTKGIRECTTSKPSLLGSSVLQPENVFEVPILFLKFMWFHIQFPSNISFIGKHKIAFSPSLLVKWHFKWYATFSCGFSYPWSFGRPLRAHTPGREALTFDFEPTCLSLAFKALYNLILASYHASLPPYPSQSSDLRIGRRFMSLFTAALKAWTPLLWPNQRFSPL